MFFVVQTILVLTLEKKRKEINICYQVKEWKYLIKSYYWDVLKTSIFCV